MDEDVNFFQRAGEAIGELLARLAALFDAAWQAVGGVITSFFSGLANGLGVVEPGLLTWVLLFLALWLLYRAVRGLIHGAVVSALVIAALGIGIIAWVAA